MDVIKACRVCLDSETQTQLLSLDEKILIDFEEVLGCKINLNKNLPKHICKMCKRQIHQYTDFKSRCWHVQQELNGKLASGVQITKEFMKDINKTFQMKNLEKSKVLTLFTGSYGVSIKIDEAENLNEGIKNEFVEDENECKDEDDAKDETECKDEDEEKDEIEFIEEEYSYEYEKLEHDDTQSVKNETTDNLEESIETKNTETENHTAKDICLVSKARKRVAKKKIEDKSPSKKKKKPSDVIIDKNDDANVNKDVKSTSNLNKDVKSTSNLKKDVKSTSNLKKDGVTGSRVITPQNLKKYNMQMKILTKEEQVQMMLSRKESKQYKQARLKCEICYKPYSALKALQNHTAKHKPSAHRPIECALCHLYMSRRSMRDHLNTHENQLMCVQCGEEVSLAQMKLHFDHHAGVMFECKDCSKVYNKKSTYKSHLRAHHADVQCTLCGEVFFGRQGVFVHVKKAHLEEAREQCSKCQHFFSSEEAQQRHLRENACGNHGAPCGWCGAAPGTMAGALAAHIAEQHEQHAAGTSRNKFFCTECNISFRLEATLIAHWWRVHKKSEKRPEAMTSQKYRSVICELCGAMCVSNFLKIHMMKHTGERPHQCKICHKRFRIHTGLKSHMLVHSGQKPFRCPQCPKAYRQDPHLRLHMRTHTGEKPYKCDVCQKAFACKSNRDEHARTVHEGLPPRRRELRGRGAVARRKRPRAAGTGVSARAAAGSDTD